MVNHFLDFRAGLLLDGADAFGGVAGVAFRVGARCVSLVMETSGDVGDIGSSGSSESLMTGEEGVVSSVRPWVMVALEGRREEAKGSLSFGPALLESFSCQYLSHQTRAGRANASEHLRSGKKRRRET